jgi:Mrp family chromosome partitioning ATPase
MTRIFEALKKSQGRAGALPFPPSEAAPLRPAVTTRPAVPVAPLEPGLAPRIEVRPTVPLADEVVREMTALRIGLESALESRRVRVVMFLGSMTGEGVTTVATQFASVIAADGRGRVLLLDAQATPPRGESGAAATGRKPPRAPQAVRRPQPGGTPGARGGLPLSVALLNDEIRRAGGRAPAAVRAFFATVSGQFDWVVVDGAPVLESPESVDLAPLVDGVVLVVRSGHTKRPVIVRAVELLRKSGARVLGTVLNRRRLEIPDFIYRRV